MAMVRYFCVAPGRAPVQTRRLEYMVSSRHNGRDMGLAKESFYGSAIRALDVGNLNMEAAKL